MKKRTLYIAGKVTGMEAEAVIMFERAEKHFTNLGFKVINPLKLNHNHDKKWISYMKVCYKAILDNECDCIYFLPNWKSSKGSKDEFYFANLVDLEFLNLPNEMIKERFEQYQKIYFNTLEYELLKIYKKKY